MSELYSIENEEGTFKLPAQLEIADVEAVQSTLVDFLSHSCSSYHIDGSSTERITTPVMQLLLAAQLQAQKQHPNATFTISNMSSHMRDSLEDIGLLNLINQ